METIEKLPDSLKEILKKKGFDMNSASITDVIEWVFEKYKYSIEHSMDIPESGTYDGCYVFRGLIKSSENYKLQIDYTSEIYPTIKKAYEAAIRYCLNNLVR